MLVLSRLPNESIVIDNKTEVMVIEVCGERVKLGINAPRDIPVHRFEVWEEIQRERESAGDYSI